ncbi:sugar 3,4-ketoisomerase [Acinetobacter lwoffii]|jgi:dTDP-4-dehydrorhamnose 3,5-epimerase-like enzyme|uniref:sugar 3,4-ketoisomerase n=1 Tax=Acinetobacter lwoffii TaxID=28090 RepID=UPI001FF11028|nr:FdtA/QdtA family cupin domain-containing protein [Acinetobacter lwoffii]MCJ8513145.1 FdtA/QdtA family cupin domain-containing protein [Acinetobacter lwoffii]
MNLIEWIELPNLGDHRGSLVVAEANRNIPFSIQRLYYIFGAQPDVPRGFHAHKELQQIAFCIQGSCKILMNNGKERQEVLIGQPNKGLFIPPMVWHEMHGFSEDCILLVLASDHYDESDYIRNYDQFLEEADKVVIE